MSAVDVVTEAMFHVSGEDGMSAYAEAAIAAHLDSLSAEGRVIVRAEDVRECLRERKHLRRTLIEAKEPFTFCPNDEDYVGRLQSALAPPVEGS